MCTDIFKMRLSFTPWRVVKNMNFERGGYNPESIQVKLTPRCYSFDIY